MYGLLSSARMALVHTFAVIYYPSPDLSLLPLSHFHVFYFKNLNN